MALTTSLTLLFALVLRVLTARRLGTSKSCSAWPAIGISRWCRACTPCRTCRTCRPFGCTICGAGCNFSVAQFLKSFRTKQTTFSDSLRKIFQKTTENARSWCLCQVLGSWGSRLHGNGEPWYRLRTLHHSLDGRGGRNPGASGARIRGWNWGWRRWVSADCWTSRSLEYLCCGGVLVKCLSFVLVNSALISGWTDDGGCPGDRHHCWAWEAEGICTICRYRVSQFGTILVLLRIGSRWSNPKLHGSVLRISIYIYIDMYIYHIYIYI